MSADDVISDDVTPDDVDILTPNQLGATLRAVRIAAGLTQADAAALCGVSGPFLSGLERGKSTVRLGLVLKVCRALGVRLRLEVPGPPAAPNARRVRRPSPRRATSSRRGRSASRDPSS